jgi:hypothetical protein
MLLWGSAPQDILQNFLQSNAVTSNYIKQYNGLY